MKAPTPCPWAVSKHATPDYAPQYGVYAGDGSGADLAIVRGENAEADAELIVCAVNCHTDLLAASEAALTDWHSHPRNFERKEPPYLAMLRAAIRKARS